MRFIPILNRPVPLLAVELAAVAACALLVALVVIAARAWRELRADERRWDESAGWDDAARAAIWLAVEAERWRTDVAEIHADERAIDQWLEAGCPADRVPYAITGAAARHKSRLVLVA